VDNSIRWYKVCGCSEPNGRRQHYANQSVSNRRSTQPPARRKPAAGNRSASVPAGNGASPLWCARTVPPRQPCLPARKYAWPTAMLFKVADISDVRRSASRTRFPFWPGLSRTHQGQGRRRRFIAEIEAEMTASTRCWRAICPGRHLLQIKHSAMVASWARGLSHEFREYVNQSRPVNPGAKIGLFRV
jgi:hypothetical protein